MPQKKQKSKPAARRNPKTVNQFLANPEHVGEMTVRQLVELVSTDEFPKGLDTRICIGDVEGNLGVNSSVTVTAHKPNDVVLSMDMHGGDMKYYDALLAQEG